MKSALNWVGNKERIVKDIKALEVGNKVFVEAFGGSIAYSLSRNVNESEFEVVNDIQYDVVNFWEVVKYDSRRLVEMIKEYDLSGNFFEREIYNLKTNNFGSCIERALSFLIINKTCFMMTSVPDIIRSKQDKNRSINKEELINLISSNGERLRDVVIENMDYKELMEKYTGSNNFIFLDPPYCGDFKDYTEEGFPMEEYIYIKEKMEKRDTKILLVINDHNEFIKDLFKDFNSRKVEDNKLPYGSKFDEIFYYNY